MSVETPFQLNAICAVWFLLGMLWRPEVEEIYNAIVRWRKR